METGLISHHPKKKKRNPFGGNKGATRHDAVVPGCHSKHPGTAFAGASKVVAVENLQLAEDTQMFHGRAAREIGS